MIGLLIAAHGSRKQSSNEEVLELARQIEELSAGVFDQVACGFVQFAAPTVESQIEELIRGGADTIVLFPYFLGSGSHVSNDIPRLVQQTETRHPGIRFRVTPHLGKLDGLRDLVFENVLEVK